MNLANFFYILMGLFYTLHAAVTLSSQSPLPNVRLVDQNERVFQLHELKGKHLFISFLYTNCPSEAVCPLTAKLTHNLNREWKKQLPSVPVQFLLVTLDPDRDSPIKLKAWAQARGISDERISLVTGDRASLQELKDALKVSASAESDGNFIHDPTSFLVDKNLVPVAAFDNNSWDTSHVLSRVESSPAIHAGNSR